MKFHMGRYVSGCILQSLQFWVTMKKLCQSLCKYRNVQWEREVGETVMLDISPFLIKPLPSPSTLLCLPSGGLLPAFHLLLGPSQWCWLLT